MDHRTEAQLDLLAQHCSFYKARCSRKRAREPSTLRHDVLSFFSRQSPSAKAHLLTTFSQDWADLVARMAAREGGRDDVKFIVEDPTAAPVSPSKLEAKLRGIRVGATKLSYHAVLAPKLLLRGCEAERACSRAVQDSAMVLLGSDGKPEALAF
ncbi:unnamed protein product, partial [Chrysoparadoxa australica]